ncbi:ArsR/SmtB family transcription factor [Marinilabilia rubra]|uniref:Transcriptional regulator n=1 Tax=Marinilabilia rubra TaxID=2162893 RepID=A0A2U2B6B8_9BACT|nr:winged helix-turn-helix domain-containing protein [Marinilabilia rubra]PWD98618.1 transcriptional regulator [Marinilabilia rubra]
MIKQNIKPVAPSTEEQKLARYAKALGHPIRVYILNLLANQACCYSGDLSQELPIAKSTLSQHLKELKESGLIQGQTEPPRIKYCVNKNNWEEAKKMFKDFWAL